MLKKCLILSASLLLIAGAAWLAPSADADKALPQYQVVAGWLKLPEGSKLGGVTGVASDALYRVYLFHRGKQPIMVFDRDGKFLRSWGDAQVKTAHGLRIDGEGNVWTTDIGNQLVIKYSPEGKVLLMLGKKDQPGDGTDQFNKPADVA